MLNIEQELETSSWGSGHNFEVRNPVIDTHLEENDIIRVELYQNGSPYTSAAFWRKTGVYCGHEGLDQPRRLRPKSATKPVNHFYILAGMKEWEKEHWVRITNEHYDDGKSAAERAKQHNGFSSTSLSPFRFMVKKEIELSPIRDFPSWAEFRFESGEWIKVPWADEEWVIKDHFAHLSVADDCMVAFWPDEAAAQMDTVTVMSPGKYLQQYYKDILSPTQIRDWAVKVDVECELHVTMDEEEMVKIYTESGIDSCMRYPDKNWTYTGNIHPIRAYAGGDLGIAYLKRRNKIVARALVWPEKKVAGRCYGDIERMTATLEQEGYTLDARTHNVESCGDGGFEGAKLKVIRPTTYPRNLVLPYLDYKYCARYTYENEVETLILTMGHSSNIGGRQTCGLAWDPGCEPSNIAMPPGLPAGQPVRSGDHLCTRCDEYFDEDDCQWLGDDLYCDGCYDRVARTCSVCDCIEHVDNTYYVDDERYCDTCYNEHTSTCDYCCERTSSSSWVLNARTGEPHATACDSCYQTDDQIVTDNQGRTVDRDTVNLCDGCGEYYPDNLDECPCQEEEEREAA